VKFRATKNIAAYFWANVLRVPLGFLLAPDWLTVSWLTHTLIDSHNDTHTRIGLGANIAAIKLADFPLAAPKELRLAIEQHQQRQPSEFIWQGRGPGRKTRICFVQQPTSQVQVSAARVGQKVCGSRKIHYKALVHKDNKIKLKPRRQILCLRYAYFMK